MPFNPELYKKLVSSNSSSNAPTPDQTDLIFQLQTRSDLAYGTPAQRLAQAKAKQAATPVNLKSALTDLLNFPGTTVNVTPTQIQSADYFLDRVGVRPTGTKAPLGIKPVVNTRDAYAQNLGKGLIVDNLTKSIEDLERDGVNDENVETLNNIFKEIDGYSIKALDRQKFIQDRLELNYNEYDFSKPSAWGRAFLNLAGAGGIEETVEGEKDLLLSERKNTEEIESVTNTLKNKLSQIKAPYLGKKFLEEYLEFTVKDPFQRYSNNPATQFNKLFDPNKSWKDNDSFIKAMQGFAYENASPGEAVYALDQTEIQKLLAGEDLSEAERVTAKALEETTLNGIANYFYKEAENAQDDYTRNEYTTALKNINKRISNSKKNYDIDSYGKWERSAAQLGIQAARSARSLISVVTPYYEYQMDAAHLGNDIRFGPVPVDLNNDGKLDVDKYGNLLLSNQFTYIKADGSLGFNAGAIPELSSAVIGQMAPIIAVDFFGRGIGKALTRSAEAAGALGVAGRAAANLGKNWEALNAWNGLRIADRVSTFGLVTGSVYENMYQDELRWTKDKNKASQRALGRSVIEGLTEAIGAPEIGMFTTTRFAQSVDRQLLDMFTPRGTTISDKLGSYLRSAGTTGKLAFTQSITESLEEEMSLYGNYLLGKMIKSSDTDYGKEDAFGAMEASQTFLDSLVAMAPYSLLGVGIQQATSRRKLGPEHEALWNMANDPEYYKAKIKDLVDKKKFTPEQAVEALKVVTEAKGVLDSIPEFKNIKDLRTLLSDHDAQKKYFHDVLYQKKLQSINYEELTDDQKDALKDAKIANHLNEKGRIELNKLAKKKELTEEEQERKTLLETLKNMTSISGHQFTQAEKKKLVGLGILKEKDLENSPEDLLAELENVDKKILKSRERADQFLNMTDEEKEETIVKLFNEQIDSVQSITDPKLAVDRLEELNSQLQFITTVPTKYQTEYTGRQALVQALEQRLGELTAINPETGRNRFTEDFLEDSTEGLTHWELQQRKSKLEKNKQFINETDYAELEAKYGTPIKLNIWAFNQMSAEEQEAFLVDYLTQVKNTNPDILFELKTLEDSFTLTNSETKEVMQPNITQEMFESVRNKVFEIAAKEKKEEMQPEAVETEEELSEDTSAFTSEEEQALTTKTEADETGKADRTVIQNLFDKLNKTNDKKSTLSAEAFANKLIAKIVTWLKKNKVELDPELFKQVSTFIKKAVTNKYNSVQLLSEGKALLEKMPEEIKDRINGVFNLAKFAGRYFKNNPRRKSLVTGQPMAETTKDLAPEEAEEESEEEPTPESKLQQQANAEAAEKEKDLVARQNAVIQLQIPSSTYGFEVPSSNRLSEDPAIQRNAEILRLFTREDYSTHKVRITSRSNFLQQLAEAQGLKFQDFLDLLNKAHEEYTKAKGSPSKKAEQIAPLLKQLNDFFGEDFFEQTFDSSRGVPELVYMIEKNGSNLSDPILTIVNAQGNIQNFNGYPFYTNIDSDPTILSKEDTEYLPYWENILGDRVAELEQFAPIAEAVVKLANTIKDNPTHSEDFPISRITQGTYITETETLTNLAESGLEITEENIKVLQTPKQKLGEETIAGVPGQGFVIINETPVVLLNDKVVPEEAEALAAMVFDKALREKFFPGDDAQEEAEKLKKHIEKVFNIYQKQGRKVAFAYDKETEELVPFIPGVSGQQLNQAELTALFKLMFYNISKNQLSSNVPRFSMQEGEVVKVADQSYVDFVKSTNKVYMTGDNPGVRRNQRIIFDMGIAVAEVKPKLKLSVKAKQPAQETKGASQGKLKINLKTAPQEETEKALEILEAKQVSPVASELDAKVRATTARAELVTEIDEKGKEVSYYLIDGVRYERVSDYIPFSGDKNSFAVKRALKIGGLIDTVLRDVFAGKVPTKPDLLSDTAFKSIVAQANIVYEALKPDYIINTDSNLIVWDEDAKVAGAIDMLLINKKTGEVEIVDFKTSSWFREINNKIMTWNTGTQSFDIPIEKYPKEDNVQQQNSYGVMFTKQYQVVPNLNLMYIQLVYKDKNSENVTFSNILQNQGEPIITIPSDPNLAIDPLKPNAELKSVAEPVAKEQAPVSDKKTATEKELFSETDSKGRTSTFFSNTKEKDGRITTTFSFNRSDKDSSQRNNATSGVPVEKALGDKYTIDEDYIPEGAKVVGVSEIRITEKGAGATVTFEVDGERYQGEVKLNSNTTYDAELATLGKTTSTQQGQPAPTIDLEKLKQTPEGKEIENRRRLTTVSDEAADEDNYDGYSEDSMSPAGSDEWIKTGEWYGTYINKNGEKEQILANSEKELLDTLNAKYDAELAVLEEAKPTEVKPKIDTSREWKGDLESRPVYTPEGVNTMRTESAKDNEHFGNPFSKAGYGGTIKVPSIGAAVVAYKEWLLGTNYQDVKPQQRDWILDQINQGKLDGATLLYAGKLDARGEGMHPTALAEVVEQLRGSQISVQATSTQVTPEVRVAKVISGGQTGVDRLGLEVAKELGIETGGVAPKGYKTEKGSDTSLKDFGLTQDTSSDYNPRTEKNVKASDGTVLFGDVSSAGSKLTISLLKKNNKPYIVNPTQEELADFLAANNIQVLNVAGNRGSKMKADQINSYKEILRGALVNTTKVGKSEVQEVSKEEKETFSLLAASITVDQVKVGEQKKKYCGEIGVTKPGKTF